MPFSKSPLGEVLIDLTIKFNQLIDDLLSTLVGKGASQIGIEDSTGRYSSTNVEDGLAEIAGSGRTTETVKGNKDLIDAHISDIVNPTNLLSNGNFESWSAGTTSPPDGWEQIPAGSIARESSIIKIGRYSAKETNIAGGNYSLAQFLPWDNYFRGRTFTLTAWVNTNAANRVYISIYDGVTNWTKYHSGSGTWELLTLTATIGSTATEFRVEAAAFTAGDVIDVYVDGAILVEGKSAFAFREKPIEEFSDRIRFWSSGILDLPKQSGCLVTNGVTQVIPSGADTKVVLNGKEYDTQNEFDATTNYRWTTTKVGKYLVTLKVRLETTDGMPWRLSLYKNGAAHVYFFSIPGATTTEHSCGFSIPLHLGAGDYLEMYVYQTTGANKTLYETLCNCHFSVTKLF